MKASPASSTPEVSREEFRELLGELRDLQARVSALEQHTPKPAPEPASVPVPELHVPTEAAPAIGRALLAIAGAYLLRALTEMHVLPATAGVAAGILYAGFWLWHAALAKGKLAATVNTLSALFIFIALIWEATARLQAIPAWIAAVVVTAFSLAAIRNRRVAAWSCAAGAVLSIALLIDTRDLLPFTIALVAIAAGAEFAAIGTRPVTALCADAGVLILITLVGRAGGLPEGYAPISTHFVLAIIALLFMTFAGNAAARTLIRGGTFTIYEIGQTACAVALTAGGVLYLTKAALTVGLFAAIAGAVCYAIAAGTKAPSRNIHAYATFGALLVMGGTFLLFSGAPLIAAWSALAIGLSWSAFASIHVPAFLWLAAAVSGVAAGSASQLFGGASGRFPSRTAIIILVAAAICYLRIARTDEKWPALFTGAAFVWSATGLAASLGAGAVVLMLSAIAFAWSGERWRRRELIWLMYAAMAITGGKILSHDFSRESTMTLVVSLLCYGATLILLPRILKKS